MENNRKKRILYLMPDNPLGTKAGNLTRTNYLLDYFERNKESFDVDFVSYLYWDEESKMNFSKRFPTINLKIVLTKMPKDNLVKYFFKSKIPKLLERFRKKAKIDEVTPYLKTELDTLQKERKYDIALISYSKEGRVIEHWSNTYCILDTHDFLTLQKISSITEERKYFGQAFQEEIDILNLYDEVWTYSSEEHYIFDQFTNANVKLVPVSSPIIKNNENSTVKYPILYVASDNHHNIKSMNWFIEQVLPLLGGTEVFVIGKICSKIQNANHLIKLGVVDDLDEFYQHSKVIICPMLSGTGIKIKVLEALSYGLPVVTTRRGVDGLVNKSQNGCLISNDPLDFAQNIKKLLEDPIFYQEYSLEAKVYFEKHHHPNLELEFLDNTFHPNIK
ncbi:glycosyltransferase family 4 protein [Sphingobacterium sp. SRCM116780]|uniref:glycosyltransferase n=1 Tax=Sphingobacterium sp. SRCM116780 TaxID=2907623 RepID=UPI001F1BDC57|nr:glycosyltransferase family 4 protein [Sphingobacterium sp. SRCM116780]UIR56304.1 glycosyltransferase family 4 protein [Sphingobacterium sp. SRCM116780]